MRGSSALGAKVFRRAHNAAAKNYLPEMIDSDPRGQRVVGLCQPLGKAEAIARRGGGEGRQGGGGAARDARGVRLRGVVSSARAGRQAGRGWGSSSITLVSWTGLRAS